MAVAHPAAGALGLGGQARFQPRPLHVVLGGERAQVEQRHGARLFGQQRVDGRVEGGGLRLGHGTFEQHALLVADAREVEEADDQRALVVQQVFAQHVEGEWAAGRGAQRPAHERPPVAGTIALPQARGDTLVLAGGTLEIVPHLWMMLAHGRQDGLPLRRFDAGGDFMGPHGRTLPRNSHPTEYEAGSRGDRAAVRTGRCKLYAAIGTRAALASTT